MRTGFIFLIFLLSLTSYSAEKTLKPKAAFQKAGVSDKVDDEDEDDDDESDDVITANVTLASDYYLRGLSQTGHQPALQGGFDADLPHGFSLGTWGSNVHFAEIASSLELDGYGKYTYDFTQDLHAALGALYYSYWSGIGRNRWDFSEKTEWKAFSLEVDYSPKWQAQDTASWYVQAGWQDKVVWDFKLGVFVGHSFHLSSTQVLSDGSVEVSAASEYSDFLVSVTRKVFDVEWSVSGVYVDKAKVDGFDGGLHLVFGVSKSF